LFCALFRASTGRRLGAGQIWLRFAQLIREAGIDRLLSIHSLRRTFATRLYEKTATCTLSSASAAAYRRE